MADLQKTQAQWDEMYKVLGAEVQVLDAIEAAWRRCKDVRSVADAQLDEQGIYASIDLGGDAEIGVNADDDGFIYVSYASAAGGSTQLYSDSARTALVASGATVSGTTSTLNEKNSSGFDAVQVTLNSGPGGGFVDDSDIRFEVSQDFDKLLKDVYAGNNDDAKDASKTKSKERLSARITSTLSSLHSRRWDDFVSYVLAGSDAFTAYIADFLELSSEDVAEGAGVEYGYDTTTIPGQVLISDRFGAFASMRLSMQEESVAGAQSVAQATKTIGNLVAVSSNQGHIWGEGLPAASASVLTLALDEHAFSGTLKLRCTQDTPGSTLLSVQNVLAEEFVQPMEGQSSAKQIEADNDATVSKRFQDGPTAVDFTANYGASGVNIPALSGDDGTILSGLTLTGINATDTDIGKIYVTIERTKTTAIDGSDEFTMSVYSNSGRTLLRGSDTFTAIVGTDTFSITLTGGAIFAGNFEQANADTKLPNKGDTDNDIECDLRIPRVGDKWEVALIVTHASRLNRKIGQRTGGSLPATGSPTFTAGFAAYHPIQES